MKDVKVLAEIARGQLRAKEMEVPTAIQLLNMILPNKDVKVLRLHEILVHRVR